MPEPNTISPSQQPLLSTFLTLLQPFRSICLQERPVVRLTALAVAMVINYGRQTITQALATLGVTGDWSAFYRLFNTPRLHADDLARQLGAASLALMPLDAPVVVAIDSVQIPRSSQHFPGSSWMYNPTSPVFKRGIHRAQRWVHLAMLLPQSATGYSRAVPVRFDPAIPEKGHRPKGIAARTEWEVGLDQLHWMRTMLDQTDRDTQSLLAVADSGWQGAGVWSNLPARTTLVAGCRANRALYALPRRSSGCGRPRQYGDRAPRPDAWLSERTGWRRLSLVMRGRIIPVRYRLAGPYLVKGAPDHPVMLLVVRGSQPGHGTRARRARFWLVNAVQQQGRWVAPLPAESLIAWCWQRWEIEVTHRELKTGFGVGQGQSWNEHSAFLTVQWQVTVYALLLLAGYRCWGLHPGPVRPPGTWWRGSGRWSLDQVRQAIRKESGMVAEFRPVWQPIPGNWWKITDWIDLQTNATLVAGQL